MVLKLHVRVKTKKSNWYNNKKEKQKFMNSRYLMISYTCTAQSCTNSKHYTREPENTQNQSSYKQYKLHVAFNKKWTQENVHFPYCSASLKRWIQYHSSPPVMVILVHTYHLNRCDRITCTTWYSLLGAHSAHNNFSPNHMAHMKSITSARSVGLWKD